MGYIERYGRMWPDDMDALQIELACIQSGGKWKGNRGQDCGLGLFHHYRTAQSLCWPGDDHHRWSDLILNTVLAEPITTIQGGKDSGKTHGVAKFGLIDYWAFPETTLILISSTELRGADYRIWGDLKDLFRRAREIFSWLPGKILESKHALCTDDLDDDDIRDPRKGIVFIPCFGAGGQWLGLRQYSGIKQERRRLLGDEIQFMSSQYLNVIGQLHSGNFKGVFMGNPIGQGDPLDKLAEPVGGWGKEGEVTKTTTWRNTFGGVTINLVGTDSPNYDFSQQYGFKRYRYLIGKIDIERLENFYGKDSSMLWMQGMGIRKGGLSAKRVLTEPECLQFHAMDAVTWMGATTTLVAGLDAAYGGIGGDRCVLVVGEFGEAMDGDGSKQMLKLSKVVMVPVSIKKTGLPEDQIADFCREHCESLGIAPGNFFFDGRGSMAISLARRWSPDVNAVEFGGAATKRPVSQDSFVYDQELKVRRLKRCDEEYSKFVTELWFSLKCAIQSGQVRELPREVMEEGCKREWRLVARDRREVETKAEMKERTNQSPDLVDAAVIMLEGARRRGFSISKLANEAAQAEQNAWLLDLERRQKNLTRRHGLTYAQ